MRNISPFNTFFILHFEQIKSSRASTYIQMCDVLKLGVITILERLQMLLLPLHKHATVSKERTKPYNVIASF